VSVVERASSAASPSVVRGRRASVATGAGAPVAARPLWQNRDFVLLWSGQVVSITGTQISTLALPLLVLALSHATAQAGLAAAARLLPYLLLSLPAGVLVDRWDRKRVIIVADFARLLAYGSVPVAYAMGRLGVAQLYAVALVDGTAFIFFDVAQLSCLPRVVPSAQLPGASAFNASGQAFSYIAGPGLGGLIVGLARTTLAGATPAYVVDGLSYLVSVLSLGAVRTPFQAARHLPGPTIAGRGRGGPPLPVDPSGAPRDRAADHDHELPHLSGVPRSDRPRPARAAGRRADGRPGL
jgi:MFS family permease